MVTFTIPGQPLPKQRPRRSRNGTWYSPSRNDERRIGEHVKWQMHEKHVERLSGPVALMLRFYRLDKRRVDADNLAKAVLDGLNGILYTDDDQVTSLTIEKHVNQRRPRTEIEVEAQVEVL